jgi:hypothetical protein
MSEIQGIGIQTPVSILLPLQTHHTRGNCRHVTSACSQVMINAAQLLHQTTLSVTQPACCSATASRP